MVRNAMALARRAAAALPPGRYVVTQSQGRRYICTAKATYANIEIKMASISLLARQKGISSLLLAPTLSLRIFRLSLKSCRNCQDLMHRLYTILVRFRAYADGKSRL